MLVPLQLLNDPLFLGKAEHPVYLKDCSHQFEMDSIVLYFQRILASNNAVNCPSCRHVYPLIVTDNQTRDEAIGNLFKNVLRPVLVPREINEIAAIMSPLRPGREGEEQPGWEEIRISVQQTVQDNLALDYRNRVICENYNQLAHMHRDLIGMHHTLREEHNSDRKNRVYERISLLGAGIFLGVAAGKAVDITRRILWA